MTPSATHIASAHNRAAVKGLKLAVALALAALLVAVPWFSGYATQRLMVEIFTLYAIALAWNLLAGYGGIVAVGQHVFIGIGAYSLFSLSTTFNINPWLMIPAAVILTVLFALIFAIPMFRLRGAYFAVGTWVLAEMARIAVLNTEWLGAGGGIPLSTMMGVGRWLRNAGVYWAALAVGLGSLLVVWWLLRGRLGLALLSVRDNEEAASASGVNVLRTKVVLWLVAAAITGGAGCCRRHRSGPGEPSVAKRRAAPRAPGPAHRRADGDARRLRRSRRASGSPDLFSRQRRPGSAIEHDRRSGCH
jgi:branched-chain amino acid transport system permease protein